MKKLLKYTTIAALGLALLTGCKKKDPTPTALSSVGTNTTAGSVDLGSITRQIYVSGLSGKIHEVKVNFMGSSRYTGEVELYLKSPSGKVLQLCADEAGASSSAINVTFTDAASISVANWTSSGSSSFSGTFKPRGSLNPGYTYTGTTSDLAGYKGNDPNGTWTLYVTDDTGADYTYFTSWELFLSTVK